MTKQIIALGLVLLLGYIGYESYQVYSAIKGPKENPIQEYIPATSTDMEGNVVSNTPDKRFGGDGQEDPVTGPVQFTMADIASHNNATSCYTVIRGTVYDLTNFITKHPGGAKNILKLCGTDGTQAFENKHGGKPKQEEELQGHEIGILIK